MSDVKRLTWADYPTSRVKLVKGRYSTVVTVPRSMRSLFGTPEVAKATGTTDLAAAEKLLMSYGHELYAKLGKRQVEAELGKLSRLDYFARKAITDAAQVFRYNRGDIPPLEPSTDYKALHRLKSTLDIYRDMSDESVIQPGEEPIYEDGFTEEKEYYLEAYRADIVESYWQDLLTQAAMEQGLAQPSFADLDRIEYVDLDGSLPSQFDATKMIRVVDGKVREYAPVDRLRQIKTTEPLRISDVRTEYVTYVERKYEKVNTQRKWIRAVDRFIGFVGDLRLSEIRPLAAYQFAQKQEDAKPTVSNKSVTDYHTGMSLFLKYCIRQGYVEMNPFQGVGVKEYGKPKQSWLDYTPNDLDSIFEYDWNLQERLLLNILLSTGMRVSEAGSLTWERFNDTEVAGVRYFSLIDTNGEQVEVKNIGSARYIPLHPDLVLPPRGEGRLFDYTIDDNGLCSSSIGHIINPILNKLASHKRKSAHSFRGTLKVMLRDAGISKEINDIYTGHGSGDVSGTAYGGASTKTRADAIAKADIPWLKLQ